MELHIIFIHRKESYPDQHAIEAVEIMDEFSYSDNPEYLEEKLKDYLNEPDISNAIIGTVEIDETIIEGMLYPIRNPIKGKILEEKEER